MNVVIVGGGISGISAAKVILKEGNKATILEQEKEPGGLMERIANCRVGFKTFFDEIRENPNLTVIRNARITEVEKKGAGFTLKLEDGQTLQADKIIITAGLMPYDPKELKGKRIVTSLEYDAIIDQRNSELPLPMDKIAFILCVGSRCEEYPLCSSVCCSYTIREIKWTLQRIQPHITVFYNDLRFFGQEFFMEKIFRDGGVSFIRSNSRYLDEDENGVTVRYFSDGGIKEERFDFAVLAIGLRPSPSLATLSGLFGFSLNEYGFVKEAEPLKTDVEGVYVAGGALEPTNIKDAILTGFGAAQRCLKDGAAGPTVDPRLYTEEEPSLDGIEPNRKSYLFYLAMDDPSSKMLYEYFSGKFIDKARELRAAGKEVFVVTRNMVTPSYAEIEYEKARREGVVFIHLEEGDNLEFAEGHATITGGKKELRLPVDRVITSADYLPLFKEREFLMQYRSEPQLRWSPTKWGRKKYHYGFIRHPRAERWWKREIYGALGEILIDEEGQRVLPEVNEERCSGCGSCKNACPHDAIEMGSKAKPLIIFGPFPPADAPVAHIKQDTCVGCGLCASTCPSDVIVFQDSVQA